MTGDSRKKKLNNRDTSKRNVIIQWGVLIGILFVVIIVLLWHFSMTSKEAAKQTVHGDLMADSVACADDINAMVSSITSAGQAIAAVIGDENITEQSTWLRYSQLLSSSIPTPCAIAIVDMDGNGVSNVTPQVDLSQKDYFVQTRTQKYLITENDGILGNKAYVSVVPIKYKGECIGMIYMCIPASELAPIFPVYGFDGKASFAIVSKNGEILSRFGAESYFTTGSSLMNNLRSSELIDITFAKLSMRLENQVNFSFSAKKNGEEKAFISVPVGIGDWQYITVINQSHVDMLETKGWSTASNMVRNIIIAVCMFLGMIILIAVINKFRYNSESKQLADKADTDLLTDLYNKIATERRIQEFMDENSDTQCLMFLFDIDNFKKINDTMGHAFGDEVLRSLGHQLKSEFRVTDIMGRTGGDEFTLFLKSIKSDEQLEREGTRITNFFHQFKAGEYVKYSATASIGAAVYPRDAKNFQELYKAADSALYEAKRRGKNQLVFYNKELDAVSMEKREPVPIDNDGTKER